MTSAFEGGTEKSLNVVAAVDVVVVVAADGRTDTCVVAVAAAADVFLPPPLR